MEGATVRSSHLGEADRLQPCKVRAYVNGLYHNQLFTVYTCRGAVYALKQYDHFKNMMETAHNKKDRKKRKDRKKLTDVRHVLFVLS